MKKNTGFAAVVHVKVCGLRTRALPRLVRLRLRRSFRPGLVLLAAMGSFAVCMLQRTPNSLRLRLAAKYECQRIFGRTNDFSGLYETRD